MLWFESFDDWESVGYILDDDNFQSCFKKNKQQENLFFLPFLPNKGKYFIPMLLLQSAKDKFMFSWCWYQLKTQNFSFPRSIYQKSMCGCVDTYWVLLDEQPCRVRCLKVLQIPMSEVSDKMVEKHAVATLTVLDISYCLRITSKGLEAVGKSCKFLIQLKRNMPPLELEETEKRAKKMDDGEAMAIANTMPGLNRLELAYGRFGDHGLNAILTNCKALTHLDIEGCLYVELNGDLEQRCGQLMDFKPPWTDDDHFLAVAAAADDDTEDFSSSESE